MQPVACSSFEKYDFAATCATGSEVVADTERDTMFDQHNSITGRSQYNIKIL